MAQGTSHTADELLETARRRREVLRLREQGHSYRAIADRIREQFGPDRLPSGWDKRYAYNDVKRELEKVQAENQETAESVLQLELRRLDRMLVGLWEDATSGDEKAVHATLRLMKRRAALLGLDAPEQFEQAVSFMESDEYQRARAQLMEALKAFPEARALVAEKLADGDT